MRDPYLKIVQQQWQNIRMTYNLFAELQPVMLIDIQEQKIYAYPYEAFKADLNERSQQMLQAQYQEALTAHKIVIFVRDNTKRKLVSYCL